MRFKFCGDGDSPDWLLVQINTLSRMSSVKMKIICQIVAKSLLGDELDFEKVKKLTADAKLGPDEIKASLSAIVFILESSTKHNVLETALSNELQQIGLPHEHSQALCRVYSEYSASIAERLAERSLRTSRLHQAAARAHGAHFDLKLDAWHAETPGDGPTPYHFTLSKQQMAMLIAELKTASARMAQVQADL